MRLLLTGAGGLVGRHVAARAAAEPGIDLVAAGRSHPTDLPKSAVFHEADLSDAATASALIADVRPSHIIHAAWETAHPTFWHDMANLDWVIATAAMAKSFAEAGGTRFVQVGSCAQYDWSDGRCVEGVTPDRPATRYGRAKLAAFRAVEAAATDRFEAAEARLFHLYGPGENPARFVPTICRSHLRGAVPRLGSGRHRRDLLHADDVARALLALAKADGIVGSVNVAGGEEVVLRDVAEELAEIAGAAETGLGGREDGPDDPERLVGAPSTRLAAIGWRPAIALPDGLRATFEWWRLQPELVR